MPAATVGTTRRVHEAGSTRRSTRHAVDATTAATVTEYMESSQIEQQLTETPVAQG